MSTRFVVGALLVVVSLILATTVAACGSSAGSKLDPSPSGWRGFAVVPDAKDSDSVNSVAEMERIRGVCFRLPFLSAGRRGRQDNVIRVRRGKHDRKRGGNESGSGRGGGDPARASGFSRHRDRRDGTAFPRRFPRLVKRNGARHYCRDRRRLQSVSFAEQRPAQPNAGLRLGGWGQGVHRRFSVDRGAGHPRLRHRRHASRGHEDGRVHK